MTKKKPSNPGSTAKKVELEAGDQIEGRCPFKGPMQRFVCGMPLIYNSKYDVYKCSVHNHYVISREEYERRRRMG